MLSTSSTRIILLTISLQLVSLWPAITGMPTASLEQADSKVFQTGNAEGLALATSSAAAHMHASGRPAGILNHGGTAASFSGNSTVHQQLPSNSSISIGGSLLANCAGGQLHTYIVGQQAVHLNSVGNCDSIVVGPEKKE